MERRMNHLRVPAQLENIAPVHVRAKAVVPRVIKAVLHGGSVRGESDNTVLVIKTAGQK